jgi:hypothetical protein
VVIYLFIYCLTTVHSFYHIASDDMVISEWNGEDVAESSRDIIGSTVVDWREWILPWIMFQGVVESPFPGTTINQKTLWLGWVMSCACELILLFAVICLARAGNKFDFRPVTKGALEYVRKWRTGKGGRHQFSLF